MNYFSYSHNPYELSHFQLNFYGFGIDSCKDPHGAIRRDGRGRI